MNYLVMINVFKPMFKWYMNKYLSEEIKSGISSEKGIILPGTESNIIQQIFNIVNKLKYALTILAFVWLIVASVLTGSIRPVQS